jgi:hypothetical protein
MKDQILKLHTLPEAEQVEWLVNRNYLSVRGSTGGENDETIYESLAELAFRLRDEVGIMAMYRAIKAIRKKEGEVIKKHETWKAAVWMCAEDPIHWIEAALLAQEERKEK